MLKTRYFRAAFTLLEVIIVLSYLGVIATYAIPKVLVSTKASQYKAVAKEIAAALSGMHQAEALNGSLSSTTTVENMIARLNYVKQDTTTTIDNVVGGTIPCTDSNRLCYLLHNGAILRTDVGTTFSGTANTNCVYFDVDINGRSGDSSNNILFLVYYNGMVRTYGTALTGSASSNTPWGAATFSPTPSRDPSWFSWS